MNPNPIVILSCVLALMPVWALYYQRQPYAAVQFAKGLIKLAAFLAGALLGMCSVLTAFIAIINHAPLKIYAIALGMLLCGIYISRLAFKTRHHAF